MTTIINNSIIPSIKHALELNSNNSTTSSIHATNDIEAIKTWLTEFKDSPNTFISYRQSAERFIMWIMQHNLSLHTVKRENIQLYQDFLANPMPEWCGPSKPRNHPNWRPFVKGLSNSSIKLNLQILTAMFEYLIDAGYITQNPLRLIRRKIKVTEQIERYLTHKELQCILDYIAKMPNKTPPEKMTQERTLWIFNLLYFTGCRRSEVINAHMSDFIHKRGQWWFKVIGKGDKAGEIPVPNELFSALLRYRDIVKLSGYPNITEKHIPLILGLYGKYKPISQSALYKIIRSTCKNVADIVKLTDPGSAFVIERVSTHWLRHTSATHQVDAGIDIRIVKENLRHSLLETTMKYQHTESDTRHDETIKKFGKDKDGH